jgi:hypothetical protein
MSPIEAAAKAIDIHNAAGAWNKALLDNAARPSGALVYAAASGNLTGEQFARLRRELEEGFQGARNAGRPLLLEGGLDWKPLSLSPKDMDFVEAKHAAAREIALALGVPPMLLGIPGDNTYSNYQEAQRAFWRGTVLPLVARMTKAFSGWLSPAYGGRVALKADLDQVEGLSAEREALWARLNAATFLTVNEKRAAVGYTPVDVPPPVTTPEAKAGFDPNQPRVPEGNEDGGQWTDGGGGGGASSSGRVRVAQAGGTGRPRGPQQSGARRQVYGVTQSRETRLSNAEARLAAALDRIKRVDPEWQRPQSVRSDGPVNVEQRIRGLLDEAQVIEARITVVERGGVPLGFTRETFRGYGRTAQQELEAAGHRDAEPVLRGSAVTGYKYATGQRFDDGRRSDLDFAIVSQRLFRQAQDIGVEVRGRTRTVPLNGEELRKLNLEPVVRQLSMQTNRKNSIVIYETREALEQKGPFLPLPRD